MPATLLDSTAAATPWKEFSTDFESKVFSVTSFPDWRKRILQEVCPGVVVDVGCGPLGLMLRDIAGLPGTTPIGSDFCSGMIDESRRRTKGHAIRYVIADNRLLPFSPQSIDTMVAVNAFLPETRPEVDAMFHEAGQALRRGGRLIAVLPAFEMSLIARNEWGMPLDLDLANRREWDTSGWQCYYTLTDIKTLATRHKFNRHSIERMTFSSPVELQHVRHVYSSSLEHVPLARMMQQPLFEHLLIAER